MLEHLSPALRVLGAAAVLPIGGLAPRLLIGLVVAWFLGQTAPFTLDAALFEVLLGLTLGLLAALPLYAAGALRQRGPESLGYAGRLFAWALFFSLGGPLLWALGLGRSFEALPAGDWPALDRLVEGGGQAFYVVLLLGLPTFLVDLIAGPASALIDRVGLTGGGAKALLILRPLLVVLALAALLPLLLDALSGPMLAALNG